ncbi:hypothetical protein SAMN05428949_2478 [Chitinophaga sp. YR627]|uniref:hypothetical protein n=1 Tax=Chitinophaga sp. YR627 TaxID=1881041 RepID=UPI0008F000EA|nr:hypothetical protein [Chitinophaga sp. YR627]SFN33709.1 hypothetical protein SAMN05428949_2478 [Chitinophaga sp. YR627]
MRNILIIFLFGASFIFEGCNNDRNPSSDNSHDSSALKNQKVVDTIQNDDSFFAETPGGTFDPSYTEKKVHPFLYHFNDTTDVVCFEDSIQGDFCRLYLRSDVGVVDSTGTPADIPMLSSINNDKKAVIVVNGESIKLRLKIKDSEIMLPTYIGSFSRSERKFLLIKMMLVSAMSGYYCYNLLLELDEKGIVISQKGIETNGEISFKQVIDSI